MTRARRHVMLGFCVLWCFHTSITFAFTGKVVGVTDGDTISVMYEGQAAKVRLLGIDCPETHQAYGQAAKRFVSDLIFGKDVSVEVVGQDKYQRTLGEVFLLDGTSLNRALLKAGLAWWFFKYSADITLGHLEVEAKAAKRGLWQESQALPPWVFRTMGSAVSRKSRVPVAQGVSPTMKDRMPILGNRRSHKYHRPDCRNYDDISEKNQVPFDTIQEAEAAGYTVAGNCPK